MSKCKFCSAELPEGVTLCPACGEENEKRISGGKTVLVIAAVAAALILVAAVLLNGGRPVISGEVPAEETTVPAAETEPPTIPADGNPDDVTCKGSYTAAGEDVAAASDVVVATLGEHSLTASNLQTFYWMEVNNFMSQYGAYAAYFGLDYQQSLDTQLCTVVEPVVTWQQHFLELALDSWKSYVLMSEEADANGFTIVEDQQASLDGIEAELELIAAENGFASVEELLRFSLGEGSTVENYRYFLELLYKATGYYNALAEQIQPTEEELEAYFDAHAESYEQGGVTRYTVAVNVRHILIYPEGADGSSLFTEEFGEEAWAAAEQKALALLEEWSSGDATEESFAELANANSADAGSNQNGGLYESVVQGEMVDAFDAWCFDADRKPGDTGIIRTEYGYHVMFFSGSELLWKRYAEGDFITEKTLELVEKIEASQTMSVDYGKILIGAIPR